MQTKLILIATLLTVTACRGRHSQTEVKNEEPETGPRYASMIKMADPATQTQLLTGFYAVESGWRWTAGNFSLMLRSPVGSAQHGATLSFSFTVPEPAIKRLGPITLTASVSNRKIGSETYSKPGPYTFHADVPPSVLAKETVVIDFSLDKSIPPDATDRRELGVIAVSAGLEGK